MHVIAALQIQGSPEPAGAGRFGRPPVYAPDRQIARKSASGPQFWRLLRAASNSPYTAPRVNNPDELPASAELPDGVRYVAQLRPSLVRYFRRKTGNPAEAEDLAHDVMVRALTHAHWKTEAEAKGYLFRSAVNRWRDRHRRQLTQGVTVSWDEDTATESGAGNSPERVLIGEEELGRVVEALQTLSPRTRSVLMLVKLENMKIASVASTLGISVRTVNNDLTRALACLAKLRQI
jgi:RNA polymerase sigma factor (sigma-70 family)